MDTFRLSYMVCNPKLENVKIKFKNLIVTLNQMHCPVHKLERMGPI
jgi:hypothetical protein